MKLSLLSKVKYSRFYLLLLSVLSGILLSAGWPVSPFAFFLFLGWVPLLFVEDIITDREYPKPGLKFFKYAYTAMLVWNVLTTWWVCNSTIIGGIFAMLANAALMTIPLVLFRLTLRTTNNKFGYISLIFYWITFEYIHLSWDLSWPWLTLGNGFASFPKWVQWYEFTGVLGGSLWIIVANLAVFFAIKARREAATMGAMIGRSLYPVFIVLLPILLSYYIYFNYEEKGEETEFVVIQPNIDPYTEKFVGSPNHIPVQEQIAHFIKLSESKITPKTKFVLWPETAIDGLLNEHELEYHNEIILLRQFVNKYPQLNLITGITSYSVYNEASTATATARFRQDVGYYDVYNTALYLSKDKQALFYHKSKLVPGVEIMPYMHLLKFLSYLVIDLGGTSGGYGRQDQRTVFFDEHKTGVAPVICYESIYGDFVAEYIRNGANFIGIITNDGWWGNTAGHKQHLVYGRLRAIETRRSIARSANTGISAYINQRGDIVSASGYWVEDVVRGSIRANNELTFYVKYGDYIGRALAFISPFLLLSVLVKRKIAFNKKRKPIKNHV